MQAGRLGRAAGPLASRLFGNTSLRCASSWATVDPNSMSGSTPGKGYNCGECDALRSLLLLIRLALGRLLNLPLASVLYPPRCARPAWVGEDKTRVHLARRCYESDSGLATQ